LTLRDREVATVRNRLVREAAARGKYSPLYRHLTALTGPAWRVTFSEIEVILGFGLPDSARLYRPWWSNPKRDAGHSHALAWQAAGWKTRAVDLESEALVFERVEAPSDEVEAGPAGAAFDLDEVWPAIPGGSWPAGFTLSREQIYDDSGRLTGGPDDEAEQRDRTAECS